MLLQLDAKIYALIFKKLEKLHFGSIFDPFLTTKIAKTYLTPPQKKLFESNISLYATVLYVEPILSTC